MNGVQTRLKCKPNVKRCKRFVFAAHSPLLHPNTLKTKAIIHFQTDHILTRFVFPPLITAVNDIIEESGFEGLGINAVAAKAKVSKMLIYRYFNSLDGLIAAYIQQNDYWINFDEELPDQAHLATFIKQIFKRQIMWLRENYTLKRLYRWELTTDNKFVKELRNKREEKGIWLVEAVSKLSKHPKKEIAAMASIITAAISYLALLEENCPVYNGLKIQQESGWEELEEGINLLVDLWLQKQL